MKANLVRNFRIGKELRMTKTESMHKLARNENFIFLLHNWVRSLEVLAEIHRNLLTGKLYRIQ